MPPDPAGKGEPLAYVRLGPGAFRITSLGPDRVANPTDLSVAYPVAEKVKGEFR